MIILNLVFRIFNLFVVKLYKHPSVILSLKIDAVDTIANHPRTQEVHSQYQNIRDAILGNITKHRSNFADFYNTALGNAKQYINRIPIYSMSHSGMHHASSLAQTAYQQVGHIYSDSLLHNPSGPRFTPLLTLQMSAGYYNTVRYNKGRHWSALCRFDA